MAGYSGSNNDGGCEKVLNQLKEFEYSIIVEKDLRPSEYSVLNDLEVDEPIIFKTIIEEYKLKLAMEIVKTMKL